MMEHKGITPVVAMVLLLMMTVAAAGGAYAWTQGIISDQQQQAQQQLNAQMEVVDLQCSASNNNLDYQLRSTGDAEVDASEVRVYKYSVATGNLDGTTTVNDGTIAPGGLWGSITGSQSTINNAFSFTNGNAYRIEFEFVNSGGMTVTGTCQAE